MARSGIAMECPPEYNQYLGDILGTNVHGQPLFRIVWGQTETEEIALASGGVGERLIGKNSPSWIVQEWKPPEHYWTPELYYTFMVDEATGTPLLGAYPEMGRYETLLKFEKKVFADGKLTIETVDLDWNFMDTLVPLLWEALETTYWESKAAQEEIERQINTAIVAEIAAKLLDGLPERYGPTSYRNQSVRTPLIERRMAEIERQWKRMGVHKRLPPRRGLHQEAV